VLSVSVPPLAEPTAISFKLTASAGSSADELPLSLGVLGRYELSFVTQNFYLEITPGSSGAFELQLRNTGYSSLTNVAVTPVSVPSDFTVDVNPPNVLLLKPGDTATFTVTVSTQATVDAGDYYVTLVVKADQVDPVSRDLHVYVRAASSTAYYMLALVVILIVAAVLAYRRFGRR
jgi:Predicted membrane protein